MYFACSAFSQEVKLPEDFECVECTVQLVRQAAEWRAPGGYLFWSCADVTIQKGMYICTLRKWVVVLTSKFVTQHGSPLNDVTIYQSMHQQRNKYDV